MLLGVGILIYTLWVTLKPVFPVEDIDHLKSCLTWKKREMLETKYFNVKSSLPLFGYNNHP